MTSRNAKTVPECIWRYYGIIEFMLENRAMYHMDNLRTEEHNRILKYYNLTRDDTKEIFSKDIEKFDAVEMRDSLQELSRLKNRK